MPTATLPTDWRLLTSPPITDGKPLKKTLSNTLVPLRSAPEFQQVICYDEFSRTIVKRSPAPWDLEWLEEAQERDNNYGPARPWTEYDLGQCLAWLEGEGIYVPIDTVKRAVGMVATENKTHPLRDYLNSLRWDGRPRIDAWLTVYLGAVSTDFSAAAGAAWLISAVARIYQPGCKADHMLVLEGEQGIGKSSAAAILGGEYFTDDLPPLHESREATANIAGKWIIEMAELAAIRRTTQVESIKAYLSRTVDRGRLLYQSYAQDIPRQCVFVGTCNEARYFRDETGNRRFWPIRCHALSGRSINRDGLQRDRDQIWAEAVHRYKMGSPWHLTQDSAIEEAEEEQAKRMEIDPWQEELAIKLSGVSRIHSSEIWEYLKVSVDRRGGPEGRRIGHIMRALGYEPRTVRLAGVQRSGWVLRDSDLYE